MPRPLVIAHRGASAELPGNSLAAFERAIEQGADAVELDVRRARDGELVVVHEAAVGRVPVGRLTRREIERRTGAPVATLAEALDLIDDRAGVCLELKERGTTDAVLAATSRLDDEQLQLSSFHDRVVAEIAQRAPHRRTGLILGVRNMGRVAPLVRARRAGVGALHVRRRYAPRGLAASAHDRALELYVWTVNDDEGLERYLGDGRVAGVITDVPARAVAVRDRVAGQRPAQAAVCSAQSR